MSSVTTAPPGLLPLAGGALLASPALRAGRSTAGVVLTEVPRPSRPLAEVVDRAVLALDVDLTPPDEDLAAAGAEPALVRSVRAELRRGERVLATSVTASGPFPRVAFDAVLEADDARAVLALLGLLPAGGDALTLAVELVPAGPAPEQGTVRVRIALDRVWAWLVAAADERRTVGTAELLAGLPEWLAAGDAELLAGPASAALPALLRAARPILAEDGDRWRVAGDEPMPMTVTASAATAQPAAEPLRVTGPLPAGLTLHLVTPEGPWQPGGRATRGGPPQLLSGLQVVQEGRATPLRALLDARWLDRRPDLRLDAAPLDALVAQPDPADRRPGPLLGAGGETVWPDRFDGRVLWFLPEFVPQLPAPAASPDGADFGFEVAADGGHTSTGQVGITATVTLTLAAVRPAGTEQQAAAIGRGVLRRVPFDLAGVVLGVPYRDGAGNTAVQQIPADTVQAAPGLATGSLPAEDGSDADTRLPGAVRATFRLTDQWARLAYGALSTPGFQALPVTVTVGGTVEGWRRRLLPPGLFAADRKRAALPASATLVAVAGTRMRPPWSDDPRPDPPEPDPAPPPPREVWQRIRVQAGRSATLVVPCGSHGTFYRELAGGVRTAIGCRPAFSLGEAPARTHEPVTVAAAAGWARVLRSLLSPGRFLVVPDRMAVGRYPATDTARAYRPKLLLCSTIDARDPTAVRCVLAAGLEPDLPPWVRSAIRAELARTAHPDPVLDWWPEGAGEPRVDWALPSGVGVESVLDASGLSVVLTCDLQGLLAVQALLVRDGVRGSMSLTLPGGVAVSTAPVIGTAAVTGPFDGGPVAVTGDPATSVTLTNRTGRRIAVAALATGGEPVARVDRVLAGGESCAVDTRAAALPGTAVLDVVHTVEEGAESLEEVRAYIEDLRLAVVLVAAGPLPGPGLEVDTRIFGHDDPAPLRLTATQREQRREYLVPLTDFAADLVLSYRVTTIAADGGRRVGEWLTWPLRSAGPLITVSAQ